MKYSLLHQLVVNMRKYLSEKGKGPRKQRVPLCRKREREKETVRENNECLRALVIFADLSRFRPIFSHIKYKLYKLCIIFPLIISSTNAGEKKSSRFSP